MLYVCRMLVGHGGILIEGLCGGDCCLECVVGFLVVSSWFFVFVVCFCMNNVSKNMNIRLLYCSIDITCTGDVWDHETSTRFIEICPHLPGCILTDR